MTKDAGQQRRFVHAALGRLMTWNCKLTAVLGQADEANTRVCLEWQQGIARFVGTRLDQDRLVRESRSMQSDTAQRHCVPRPTVDYVDEALRKIPAAPTPPSRVKVAVPLLLTTATAVGVTLEAPIFVAAIFLLTLAACARAAVDAWREKSSINAPITRTFVLPILVSKQRS